MLLKVQGLHVHYGHVAALRGISFDLDHGGFTTIFGSNGAGKSTSLRALSGLEPATSGEIIFNGKNIERLSVDAIVKMGIAHVPEGRRVFKDLTVTENLRLGAFTKKDNKEINQSLEEVFHYFPKLRDRSQQLARTMSGGEQQMIAIGRALMSKPKLLLLDEPSLGLAPVIVQGIAKILIDINKEQGVSIILVEQNAELALAVANHGYVLENGKIALQGDAQSLMNNEHVSRAYFGI